MLLPYCFSLLRLGKNIQQNVKHDFLKCSQLFKLIVEIRTTLHQEGKVSLLQFVLHLFTSTYIFAKVQRTPYKFSMADLYTVLLSFISSASATTSIRASPTSNLEIVAPSKPLIHSLLSSCSCPTPSAFNSHLNTILLTNFS